MFYLKLHGEIYHEETTGMLFSSEDRMIVV